MKKTILIILSAVMVLSLASCANNVEQETLESTSETASTSSFERTTAATTTAAQPKYNHFAVQNCVIVHQDGSPTFSYYEKCDVCGKMGDFSKEVTTTKRTYGDSFFCSNCDDWRMVTIDTYE